MARETANGSTLVFGNATYPATAFDYDPGVKPIDMTVTSDTTRIYEASLPDPVANATILGTAAPAAGARGALTMTWGDGTSATIAAAMAFGPAVDAQVDGQLGKKVQFKPALAS